MNKSKYKAIVILLVISLGYLLLAWSIGRDGAFFRTALFATFMTTVLLIHITSRTAVSRVKKLGFGGLSIIMLPAIFVAFSSEAGIGWIILNLVLFVTFFLALIYVAVLALPNRVFDDERSELAEVTSLRLMLL